MSGPSIRKLYYSTAELCELADIKPYDLKKWEKQFQKIKPSVSRTGRRLYKDHDIEMVRKIREMTDRGFSIEQIEDALEQQSGETDPQKTAMSRERLHEVIDDLKQIREILSDGKESKSESLELKL